MAFQKIVGKDVWNDSTVYRVFVLHTADVGSINDILLGSPHTSSRNF